MKLKELFESNKDDLFLTDENFIHDWYIKKTTKDSGVLNINKDCSVSVDGDVYFKSDSFTHLKIKFTNISGYFLLPSRHKLKSLAGFPYNVGGDFIAQNSFSPSIKSLEDSELKEVGANFYVNYNGLTSLKGSPQKVGGSVFLNSNKQLAKIDGITRHIGANLSINDCAITSLIGINEHIDHVCQITVTGNKIKEGGIAALMIDGFAGYFCGSASADIPGWVTIINKYVDRRNAIYDCQAELIEKGFEEYAKL